MNRRRLLAALATTGLLGVAGCTGGDSGGSNGDATTAPGTEEPATTAATTEASETSATALDLREANVTAVSVSRTDGGVRFEVTLYHDDDGEDGYADWWQVEQLDGTRLGRRDLAHAHGTREFTRSATIEVPEGVGCVVVRGHDQTHGYGGQAMTVSLDDGATRAVQQGSDRAPVDEFDCP